MLYARWDRKTDRKQTLKEHTARVAALCAGFGAPVGMGKTAELMGLLHDMGKAGEGFQQYLLEKDERVQRAKRGSIDHSTAGAKYLYDTFYQRDKLCAQVLSLVICSHHSGLMDCVSPSGENRYLDRMRVARAGNDEKCVPRFFADCADKAAVEALFEESAKELTAVTDLLVRSVGNMPKRDALLLFLSLLERYLFSCLLDADRYDAYCFAEGISPCTEEETAPPWDLLAKNLEKHLRCFSQSSPVDKLRGEVAQACLDAAGREIGIYRLQVPTGGGKTLSSLRFALNQAKKLGKKRIIYAIPYTTIIDQNAKDIRAALQCDGAVLEHYASLVRQEDDQSELLTERWDAPVILTTMVQFLNTLFSGKNRSARRMHNLADSVLIFDEIQTLPPKCGNLFNAAVQFLSSVCGATVILCTATQPQFQFTKFPVQLAKDPEILPDVEEKFRQFRRTQVQDCRGLGNMSDTQLEEFAGEKLEENGSVLVVLNTKRAARRVFEALRTQVKQQDTLLFHLSTSMVRTHRQQVLDSLRTALAEGRRVLCVSTQLVEAGVNLSFRCVIRSLAGLDSIAQAAGRCNRHGEDLCRPVCVVRCAEENLSRLPELIRAQQAAEGVLNSFAKIPDAFGGDLLSPAAIRQYYQNYYSYPEMQLLMNYPAKDPGTGLPVALLDLLSGNQVGSMAARARGMEAELPQFMRQAFRTAGELFHVIEENTTDVLVPYRQGAALATQLESPCDDPGMRMKLLRQAQAYSVSLYEHEIALLLKQRALRELPDGILLLADGYYDDQLGFTVERQPLELLMT